MDTIETPDTVFLTAIEYLKLRKSAKINIGISLGLALAGGFGAGFVFAKKRLASYYADLAVQEIEEAKRFYSVLYKRDEFSTPEQAAEELLVVEAATALSAYQGERPVDYQNPPEDEDPDLDVVEKAEKVVKNVFKDARPVAAAAIGDFDYDEEVKKRTPDKPYIITYDEFMENEPEYIQNSLTYFEGDDVLADERMKPIDAVDDVVGADNLLRFGHGSKDNNIVYIRNEKIDLDFEVVRNKSKFAEDVLGILEHSDRRVRRFRRGDDG